MSRKALRTQDASGPSEGLLRMYASQFHQLFLKGELDRCREELQAKPGLLEALEAYTRVGYALRALPLQDLQAWVERGLIDASAHLGTNTDLMCTAASYGRLDVMQWLWERRQSFGHTLPALSHALLEACSCGQLEPARWLLDIGVSAGAPREWADEAFAMDLPLVAAAASGSVPLIKLLLERGADPNVPEASSGYYPIHMAAKYGKAALEPLLRAGADIDARMVDEFYSLGVLSFALGCKTEGGDEVFDYLLSEGLVDPRKHHDALLSAAEEGRYPEVKRLLDLGLDVDYQGRSRNESALMLACRRRYKAVVELLLERGADPNLAAKDGRTALVFAINTDADSNYNREVIDRLIAAGASPECVQGGRSFWQLIASAKPEVKRHIRAQVLARSMEDAMAGPADVAPAPSRAGGMSPL